MKRKPDLTWMYVALFMCIVAVVLACIAATHHDVVGTTFNLCIALGCWCAAFAFWRGRL